MYNVYDTSYKLYTWYTLYTIIQYTSITDVDMVEPNLIVKLIMTYTNTIVNAFKNNVYLLHTKRIIRV